MKRFCVKQYKIVKYTIWLILAIQMIPATTAEAFFLPLIIQAILPKANSNSSKHTPNKYITVIIKDSAVNQ